MTEKNRKTRERDSRKNEIIEAARKIFFEKKFEDATMDDIASESEFTKKTLYSYFPSKEELYATVVLQALKLLVSNFEQAVQNGKTGFEQVANVGHSYFSFFKEHPVEFRFLASKLEIKSQTSQFQEIISENEKMLKIISAAFKTGIKDGSIRKDADPMKSALYVISISRGMLELIYQNVYDFENFYGIKLQEFLDYSLLMMGASFKK